MSNSHRKSKGRAAPEAPTNKPGQPTAQTPADQPSAQTSPSLPPIEVPVIGPPRRKTAHTPPHAERPALPAGALASLNISGGMAFSHRELVVYDDGRATYAFVGQGRGQSQQSFHLSDEQMSAVRAQIAALDTGAFASRRTPAPPDSHFYEIAARVGGQIATTTVSTGLIPPQMAPLLRLLRDLVPSD